MDIPPSSPDPSLEDSAVLELPRPREDRLEIRSSRLQSFFAFGLCMLFVLGGGAMLLQAPLLALVVGPGVLLFAQLALFHLREGVLGRPRLVLDAEGLEDRQLGTGRIPWDQVLDVRVHQSYPHLLVEVRDPERFARVQPFLLRALGWMNSWFGYPRFLVNLLGLGVETERVMSVVGELRARHLTGGAPDQPPSPAPKKAPDAGAAEEPARVEELLDE